MQPYNNKIYSDRPSGLTRPCARCGDEMKSTGNLFCFDLPERPKWESNVNAQMTVRSKSGSTRHYGR